VRLSAGDLLKGQSTEGGGTRRGACEQRAPRVLKSRRVRIGIRTLLLRPRVK